MSYLPSLELSGLVEWYYRITTLSSPNITVASPIRKANEGEEILLLKQVSPEQLADIVKRFDPWKESVEAKLEDFDEETQSWRGQANYICEIVPEEVWLWGQKALDAIANDKEEQQEKTCPILARVSKLLRDGLDHSEADVEGIAITLGTHFLEDLAMDSLDKVEFTMQVECDFDILVPDTDTETWLTVGDVVDYLRALPAS